MATTTNFGWDTPDDTDLVKDGALAIRTLGSSIDTSFVDLKGGTTGQVLSKASNTDLDYTWVTTDDANAIQNAIVDAKGDLIAASAADTPARLAVGNNGETLVADSAATTGLRYQGSEAAAKNLVINGAMDFWQRGTSSSSQGYVVADRWYCSGATTTYSQETSDLPTGFRYALKLAATGTIQPVLLSAFETQDCLRFADKTVTLSYWVKSSNSTDALVRLDYSTSVDVGVTGSWTTITSNAKTTTTAWARVQNTFAVPSTAKSLRVVVGSNVNLTTGQSILITGVQLELGSVATSFTKAGGTLQGELAACQRYYYRNSANGYQYFATGANSQTTAALASVFFPVSMRTSPSFAASAGNTFMAYQGTTIVAGTAIASDGMQPNVGGIALTVASGLTVGNAVAIRANNTAAFLEFSAEL